MKPPAKRAFTGLVGMPYEPEPPAVSVETTPVVPLTRKEKDAAAKRAKRAEITAAKAKARRMVRQTPEERAAEDAQKKDAKLALEEKEREEKISETEGARKIKSIWTKTGGFGPGEIEKIAAAGDRDHGDINTPWDGISGRAGRVQAEGTGQHVGDREEHVDTGLVAGDETIGGADEKTETGSRSVHVTPPLRATRPFQVKLNGFENGKNTDAYVKRNHEIQIVMDALVGSLDGEESEAFEIVPDSEIYRCRICGFEPLGLRQARGHFENAIEEEPREYEKVMERERKRALGIFEYEQSLKRVQSTMPGALGIPVDPAPAFTVPSMHHHEMFRLALNAYRKERRRAKQLKPKVMTET